MAGQVALWFGGPGTMAGRYRGPGGQYAVNTIPYTFAAMQHIYRNRHFYNATAVLATVGLSKNYWAPTAANPTGNISRAPFTKGVSSFKPFSNEAYRDHFDTMPRSYAFRGRAPQGGYGGRVTGRYRRRAPTRSYGRRWSYKPRYMQRGRYRRYGRYTSYRRRRY